MNDRIYLRANFSTATTPASAGGRMKDAYGHEYASIPLQLPSNLIDNTRRPKEVEMLLTKMNIPLGSVPVGTIALNNIDRYEGGVRIETKGIMTIWPFMILADGGLQGGYEDFAPETSLLNWPVYPMSYPLQSFLSNKGAVAQKLAQIEYTRILDFFSIEDVMEFLTVGLNDVYIALFSNSFNTVDMKFMFSERNSRLVIQAINTGADKFRSPFSNLFSDSWGSRPYTSEGPIMTWQTTNTGAIAGMSNPIPECFSIVVNKYIRDMFPRLPWREINNNELTPVDHVQRSGSQIPNWTSVNWGDPFFYVLDTMSCASRFTDDGVVLPRNYAPTSGVMTHCRGVEFSFDGCNLISIVPVQAFVVMLSGVGMTQQTYPLNVVNKMLPSAQTSSVPIIEVYYPAWNDISDLSTNIIVSKDVFTNAAPFKLDNAALQQRDIKFTVYYVLNDGTLHELTIPPNSSLSLQVCYSISY